jgi:hypothetical protein
MTDVIGRKGARTQDATRELTAGELEIVGGGLCLCMTSIAVAAKIISNSRPSCDDMPGPGCDWTQ